MFNLPALTELREAELTVGEARMGLCEEGQDLGHSGAQERHHGYLINACGLALCGGGYKRREPTLLMLQV